MSRGIYKNVNGQWTTVVSPSVKKSGTWTGVQKGFVNQNGVWKQFYPGNVLANILVVGGGGGGGIGYGWEGGGGGGAGGVVYQENVLLSAAVGSIYDVTVGLGGGANASGGDSSFGTIVNIPDSADSSIYAYSLGVYNGFLNTYGVWVSPQDGWPDTAPGTVTVTYTTYLKRGGNFTLTASADNRINSVSLNGGPTILTEEQWWNTNSTTVTLSSGINTITITATNDGGPASFAASLTDSAGDVVWHTRSPLSGQGYRDGLIAFGGGNGGW